MQNISALILAAGKGSRIGKPKFLLEYGDKTFLEHIYDNLLECNIGNILTVIRKESEEWFLENFKGEFVINDFPEGGMLSSVILGINSLKNNDGILIYPVDHPHVRRDTVQKLITSFNLHPGSIIKPVYKNSSGHPVIIPSAFYNEIISGKSGDLNSVIRNSNVNTIHLKTNDAGVLKNINTPEDLI
jgi:molybdenum cofactor cytidylyltransferase